jgi:hypothetical protein
VIFTAEDAEDAEESSPLQLRGKLSTTEDTEDTEGFDAAGLRSRPGWQVERI